MNLNFAFLLLLQVVLTLCNTEKIIFQGPSPIQIPTAHPTLEDLQLPALTPQINTQRTHLRAAFPSASFPEGSATWLQLTNLKSGQRYEVRVCWAATQPTAFTLSVFDLETVFSSSELITSLAQFSAARQRSSEEEATAKQARESFAKEVDESMLFFRILAKADYYTMNQTLMKNVPSVHVDIILDPYLLNVFPKSLGPTAIYIVVLACGAWFLGKVFSAWIINIVSQDEIEKGKKES